MTITIELAGEPRGKGRGRAFSTPAGARIYTDAKTRTYEAQLRFAGQQVMAGAAPLVGPLEVSVEARFPVAQSWSKKKRYAALSGGLRPCTKPDVDNVMKCLDALNQVVWVDDAQIVSCIVGKVYSERPGLTIWVDELGRKNQA